MKLTKEDIDKVRCIEGFPIGKDEDIIALSNPPYYTACPNPFIEDFIKEHGKPYDEATDDYHREPFAADVSEGKYDAIYKLHPYHTKVPHKAIMRYILHYTNPGDIVLDGFCGTGMVGIAAQMCGCPDAEFQLAVESEKKHITWGARAAIISDLSPAATYISMQYNLPIKNISEYWKRAETILDRCRKECAWMYQTIHSYEDNNINELTSEQSKGEINYVIWSDVFICPNCGEELVFWNTAVDIEKGKVKDKFKCHFCGMEVRKNDCERAQELYFDTITQCTYNLSKQVPVRINYTYAGKRYEKEPDQYDFDLINKINNMSVDYWIPTDELPAGYNTEQPKKSHGLSKIHLFYTKRNLITLAYFYHQIDMLDEIGFALTKVASHLTKQYRLTYMNGCWGAGGGPMSGTLYIPSLIKELNMLSFIEEAVRLQERRQFKSSNVLISTQSATDMSQILNNSVDYIFTDPPFGENLMYSELNFIWESWLNVKTNNKQEAIVNKIQSKGLMEYQDLMTQCFKEYFRVLKPNRWITVVFHNSKNAVWNSIQESIQRAGFIIADVRTLDKKHSSFKQVTSQVTIKQDLVISAYKPKDRFKREFVSHAGSEETAWSFVRQHLEKLPVVVVKNGKIELIAERQAFLLYDRMVAYHIMNGIAVPLDATDFYKGLDERFLKRDGMYFLADQVNEYDTARIINDVEPVQFELFVTNEKSAIAWLYQQLETPQTYAELQPKFMQEIKAWDKFEARPELAVLLEENFLQDDRGRWYIPDITKAADVAKLREKKLLKEFEGYLATKGKLKLFRTEAIRAGFAKLWVDKNYKLIVETAERLPESVIQEDDKLLMYYDLSLGRI
jgi:DNA modification methylase/predicted RNA-binding Zn-ribbon protein involved in translation (DUF1610 family)